MLVTNMLTMGATLSVPAPLGALTGAYAEALCGLRSRRALSISEG